MAVLVSSRGDFLVFFNENERTMVTSKRKIFDKSCVPKMMILLMFVLCCSVFQVFVAVLVSSRGCGFIFFCR